MLCTDSARTLSSPAGANSRPELSLSAGADKPSAPISAGNAPDAGVPDGASSSKKAKKDKKDKKSRKSERA